MTESKTMTLDELANVHDQHCWRMAPHIYIDNADSFKAGWKDCATWFYKNILELTGEEHTVAQLKKWHEREIGE